MRTLQGTVVSNRMSKTVVVRVDRLRQHPKYRKFYRVSANYKAHVEDAASFAPGDVVRMVETRPLSKQKRWRVTTVVRKQAASRAIESETGSAEPGEGADPGHRAH